MHIELTWPRPDAAHPDAAHRTLNIPVPRTPAADLLRPALRRLHAAGPDVLRGAVACAEPVVVSAASASGVGLLVRLALPYATRLTRQSLDRTRSTE